MSTRFYPYETIDYVHTINKALQRVFEARVKVYDSITYEEYLRAVEALTVILLPRIRPRDYKKLLEKAKQRDKTYGFYTAESLDFLDRLVEKIVESLDKANLLIKGETYEEERL